MIQKLPLPSINKICLTFYTIKNRLRRFLDQLSPFFLKVAIVSTCFLIGLVLRLHYYQIFKKIVKPKKSSTDQVLLANFPVNQQSKSIFCADLLLIWLILC